MTYYPEPDSQIRDKIRVPLDMTNNAAKKEFKNFTGIDIYDLAAKKDFMALKA